MKRMWGLAKVQEVTEHNEVVSEDLGDLTEKSHGMSPATETAQNEEAVLGLDGPKNPLRKLALPTG